MAPETGILLIFKFLEEILHSDISRRVSLSLYRGSDKSLARPWKETSYSDQDLRLRLKCDGTRAETRFRLSA